MGAANQPCHVQVFQDIDVVQEPDFADVQDLSAAPPFTLKDLRQAIPEECWKKNTAKSFSYLIKDVAIVLGLAAGAFAVDSWCVCR